MAGISSYTSDVCPNCMEEFDMLGQHWRWNPDHRPKITSRQKEIAKGLILGDGSVFPVGDTEENSRIQCSNINEEFLIWLDEEFGPVSSKVKKENTAEELAKANRDTGFSPKASAENYSDGFIWTSRRHPTFADYRYWYEKGYKEVPEDIDLSPLSLNVWYSCDGTIKRTNDVSPRISISFKHNEKLKETMTREARKFGVEPKFYTENIETPEYSIKGTSMYFGVEDSFSLWDLMENPIPGFSYKWPEAYHG